MTTELIVGATYPWRRELRAMGGDWDAAAQGWRVPVERAAEARAMVGGRKGRRRPAGSGIYTRFNSGAEVFRNAKGTCEDAPCCGCCGSYEGDVR
jgi:hypothetical protein